MIETPLKAPFPAFGGKSKIAPVVWERLGNPRNYIEPFAFSAAMLLKRTAPGPIETINDLNAFVSNFWRAVQRDPEAVARHADWPVNETDLHARHRWLVRSGEARARLQAVRDDPEAFDAKIAGWWCWGACCWIGSGWCESHQATLDALQATANGLATKVTDAKTAADSAAEKLPHMTAGRGVNGLTQQCGPNSDAHAKRPVFPDGGRSGRGVNGQLNENGRPVITDEFTRGRGVNSNDAAGTCATRRAWLTDWMMRLADRLRPVRVCCGHWSRVCDSPSTMTRLGTTGVFLDPPYRKSIAGMKGKNRAAHIYANDRHQDVNALCDEVQDWCLRWGPDPEVRIVLCGLEGEYPAVEAAGWEVVAWKSQGGYGNRNAENENAERERLWVSPGCVKVEVERNLFTTETP